MDKQAKVRDLECQSNTRCLPSNGVDKIVYNLYDLTPEEVVIVEGKKGKNGNKQSILYKYFIEVMPCAALQKMFSFEVNRKERICIILRYWKDCIREMSDISS